MKPRSVPLLLLLSSQHLSAAASDSPSQEWPHNLPPNTKYFPEDEATMRKYASIHKRLTQEPPRAVRKMSPDDGQMFFLDYWGFADHRSLTNFSAQAHRIQPAILPIYGDDRIEARLIPRVFSKRDFQCPSDTTSCSNIGRSDACCPNGLTCNVVTNGQVGCCQGSSCAGQLLSCPADYTTCEAFGGGCCVPGYACASGGCIKTATETIVVTPTTSSTTSSTSSTSTTPPPNTTTSPPPTTSSTTSSTSSASTCSSGYNSCAASLGGGCCPTSMICGSSTSCLSPSTSTSSPSPTSSTAIIPPARPTSAESPSSIPATITGTSCPTGFYQCSAYYNAGSCCQVGRDCGMTSCPPSNPSTVLQSDGVTVVVGNGGSAATVANNAGGVKGACATGWFSCAASLGGNCCPTGFSCGTASCFMNGTSGAAETGKRNAEKNEGSRGRVEDVGVGVLRAFGVVLGTVVMGLLI